MAEKSKVLFHLLSRLTLKLEKRQLSERKQTRSLLRRLFFLERESLGGLLAGSQGL
jgi:hypothetical protein